MYCDKRREQEPVALMYIFISSLFRGVNLTLVKVDSSSKDTNTQAYTEVPGWNVCCDTDYPY
jgi:hypothetical protein